MGALRMNSEELRRLGEGFVKSAGEFNALITTFNSQCESLTANGTWDGSDSDKFAQVATNFKNDLTKAAALVEEVGNNLVTSATNYDETFEGVQSSINAMLGD